MNCDVRCRLNGLAVQKHQGTWSRDFLANDLRMHEVLTCKQSTWQTQHNNDYESEIGWSVLTVPVSLRATLILLPHAHRSVSSFNHIILQKKRSSTLNLHIAMIQAPFCAAIGLQSQGGPYHRRSPGGTGFTFPFVRSGIDPLGDFSNVKLKN